MPNKIVHFEIPADDPEKVRAFYEKIFDWKIEKMPGGAMDYWMIRAEGVGGGILPKSMPEMTRINYISVDSVEEHSKVIEDSGGKVVMPKTAVPGMGWFAVAIDPEGNPFGIWEDDPSSTPG